MDSGTYPSSVSSQSFRDADFPLFSVIFGPICSPVSSFSFGTFCLFLCSFSVRRCAHVDFHLFSQKSSGITGTCARPSINSFGFFSAPDSLVKEAWVVLRT